MVFADVINDLIKLEGIRLSSIRPGAELIIRQVDTEQKKVIVESSSGKKQSRSFSEFERIWESLQTFPAIRVEDVLNGSGSSRNQPETIFANLPYIQWLKIDNKKHIAYIGKATHPYGTIQQMDSMVAIQTENRVKNASSSNAVILISTDNISQTAKAVTSIVGKTAKAENEGCYVFTGSEQTIVMIDSLKYHVPCGTYPEIVQPISVTPQYKATFLGHNWSVFSNNNIKLIIRL